MKERMRDREPKLPTRRRAKLQDLSREIRRQFCAILEPVEMIKLIICHPRAWRAKRHRTVKLFRHRKTMQ